MKKIKQEGPNGNNILNELHVFFMDLPIRFREEVCTECSWSLPTFYRKMRGIDKPDEHNKGRIIPAFSNAEKEGILRKARGAVQNINDFINKFK
jgi:hypothetical protein